MKVLVVFVFLITALFLPSDASAADGRNKRKAKQAKVQNCKALRGKARKNCEAKPVARNQPSGNCNRLRSRAKRNCEAKQTVAKKTDKPIGCDRMKGRAKKRCDANSAKAEARRREAARQAELRRLAEIRRRIEAENARRKTTQDNIAKDKTDGEDLVVRRMAVEALGNNAGTVGVMETQTGKVLTIVNQEWGVRKAYEPCSTIKLVTTVAGLGEHVIDEEDEEAQENLEYALAKSSNVYFQQVGKQFDYSKFTSTARQLGLGRPTGINMPGENPGQLSLVKKTSQVYSHGYGVKTTLPQQMVLVSSLFNKGKKVIPQVPVKVGDTVKFESKAETIQLPVENLEGAIRGMKAAAEYGTARKGVDAGLGIAGKTGTCSMTGTFTSVAPSNNPKYTVGVILVGDRGKGKYAAAVAGQVYQKLADAGYIPKPPKPETGPIGKLETPQLKGGPK